MMKRMLALILCTLSLQACGPAVFVAGATAGGSVVYDSRNMKTILADQEIRHEVQLAIVSEPSFEDTTNIVASSFNRVVLLVGQAPTAELRDKATAIAKTVPGIKRIYNEIHISAPASALTDSSDAIITGKVKTTMLTTSGLHSTLIKVVTENGEVYLMGLVTRKQGKLAADVARHVGGVQKVVKLFEYV